MAIPGMKLLPNGMFVPDGFYPEKMDEYVSQAHQSQHLKQELETALRRSSLEEIKTLFGERGAAFIATMSFADPWATSGNKGRSILENVLIEMEFAFPDETIWYLLDYLMEHSEQAKATNMNIAHVLARNVFSKRTASLLQAAVERTPALLHARMTGEEMDMTPTEMAIRTSYNEELINWMLDAHEKSGGLKPADKEKLLSHAEWLSGSGVATTMHMGQRVMQRINAMRVLL